MQVRNVTWTKTPVPSCLPASVAGRTSLARMIHKAMEVRRRDPCVTRRKIVDVLTPCLPTLGLRKEKKGLEEGWDAAEGGLPPALAIGDGPSAGAAGGGSVSAGCRAGSVVW